MQHREPSTRSAIIHRVSLVDAGLDPKDYVEHGMLNTLVVFEDDSLRYKKTQLPWDKLLEQLDPNLLRHGDIVHLREMGEYRNDGKYIVNIADSCGTPDRVTIEELGEREDIDDYGYVSSNYFVGDQFLADHWLDVIDHNSIVWVDLKKYGDQLRSNYDADQQTSFFDGKLGRFTVIFTAHIDEPENLPLSGSQFFDSLATHTTEIPFYAESVDTMFSENEYSDTHTLFYQYRMVN